jgi:hypothetical protein
VEYIRCTNSAWDHDVTAAGIDTCVVHHVAEIVTNLLEVLILARATYTHVWARNAEGMGGRGDEKQYVGQGADESVVLEPRFITCVTIVAR